MISINNSCIFTYGVGGAIWQRWPIPPPPNSLPPFWVICRENFPVQFFDASFILLNFCPPCLNADAKRTPSYLLGPTFIGIIMQLSTQNKKSRFIAMGAYKKSLTDLLPCVETNQYGFHLIRHPHSSLRRDSNSGPQPRSSELTLSTAQLWPSS